VSNAGKELTIIIIIMLSVSQSASQVRREHEYKTVNLEGQSISLYQRYE
jgi:hypothetical protein